MPEKLLPTATSDLNWFSWLMGLVSSIAIFFLAWGVRDVKQRFDQVPEMVKEIALLREVVENLKEEVRRLNK